MRSSKINRRTNETDICLSLCIDGTGNSDINSGCGFLDHMLTLFSKHSGFDLSLVCKGDIDVDFHHTVEDIGICLGKAFAEALGDCRGIARYGSFLLPMDEALVMCAVDISGRSCLVFNLDIPASKVGDFDTELAEEFFTAFVRTAGITLHLKKLDGRNSHHIIEAAFKGFARALRSAVKIESDEIPSTKGILV